LIARHLLTSYQVLRSVVRDVVRDLTVDGSHVCGLYYHGVGTDGLSLHFLDESDAEEAIRHPFRHLDGPRLSNRRHCPRDAMVRQSSLHRRVGRHSR